MKKTYDDVSARIFRHWPSLGDEELQDLFKELHTTNDFVVRNKIIENNIGLVVISLKTVNYQLDEIEDLFHAGIEGLIKAVDHFDLSLNVKFSVYAIPTIVGSIKHYCRDNGLVHVPRRIYELNPKILKAKEKLQLSLGREPSLKEVSEELKISEVKIASAINSIQSSISLFTPVDGDDEYSDIELIDTIAVGKDPADYITNHMSLRQTIDKLDQKEKELIYRHYVLNQTQVQIGMAMNCGQMSVSRLNKKILTKMHKELK